MRRLKSLDVSFVATQMLNGMTSASVLFITAAGLTIVFGVTRVVNFAHGSFYTLFRSEPENPWAR